MEEKKIDTNELLAVIAQIERGKNLIDEYAHALGSIDSKDIKNKLLNNLNRQLDVLSKKIQAVGIETDTQLEDLKKHYKKISRRSFWNILNNLITAGAVGFSAYIYFTSTKVTESVKNIEILSTQKHKQEFEAGENDKYFWVSSKGGTTYEKEGTAYIVHSKNSKK